MQRSAYASSTGDSGSIPNMRRKTALLPSITSAALNSSPRIHGPSPRPCSQTRIVSAKLPQPSRPGLNASSWCSSGTTARRPDSNIAGSIIAAE